MQIQEGKLSSQPEASNIGKVGGINAISSRLYDDTLDMTATISLQSGEMLNELISTNDENQVKPGDDSAQQSNNGTNTTRIT